MSKTIYIATTGEQIEKDIRAALINTEINVRIFAAASKLLSAIEQDPAPAAVFTDINLKDMNAFQLCSLLRTGKHAHLRRLPVVILSEIIPEEDLQLIAGVVGAQACLSFPLKSDKIRGTILKEIDSSRKIRLPRVVLVEDNQATAMSIAAGLTQAGYDVSTACCGEEGVRLATELKPGILIMDHLLKDNRTALEYLPAMLPSLATPLSIALLITASDDTDTPSQYLDAGADAFVRKPFSNKYLLKVIQDLIQHKLILLLENLLEKQARELKKAEDTIRDLFDNAPVGYHILSGDGTILSINKTELDWLGYKREEVIGKKIFDIQTEASALRGTEAFKELMHTGCIRDLELTFVTSDGSAFPVSVDSTASFDSEGRMLTCRSITRSTAQQINMERRMLHAQRLESIALLSDGISHNFNNLLTPILPTPIHCLTPSS
jgi:PAS domain S-box-containing protein